MLSCMMSHLSLRLLVAVLVTSGMVRSASPATRRDHGQIKFDGVKFLHHIVRCRQPHQPRIQHLVHSFHFLLYILHPVHGQVEFTNNVLLILKCSIDFINHFDRISSSSRGRSTRRTRTMATYSTCIIQPSRVI